MFKETFATMGNNLDLVLLWFKNLNVFQQAILAICIGFAYWWLINSLPRPVKNDA